MGQSSLVCVIGASDFDMIQTWGKNIIQAGSYFLFCTSDDKTRRITATREGRLA
jgi:hypothetical protein